MSWEVTGLRAVAHPIRLQMLSLLTGVSMSAAEIARELDLTQANASYHLRVLAGSGLVVETGQEKVRGGVAKKFTHPWRQESAAKPHESRDAQRLLAETIAHELLRREQSRRVGGKGITSDAEMWVEPEVWAEVVELVAQASTRIHDSAQPPRSPGSIHVNLTAILFEMDEAPR